MDAKDVILGNYIKELAKEGKREDSRGSMDFRDLKISRGVIDHAEGSAQADLGATKVLAGVKLVPEEAYEDTPDQGNLVVSAELLPLAAAEYETGPPSPEAIELGRVVDRAIRAGNCIDLKSLLLEEGKAWTVYVDVYVLNFDGNLFDASVIAAMSAILDAKVPEYADGKADYTKREKKLKVDNLISSTTFAKIGNAILLDPTGNEELGMDARLTISTDGNMIRAMQKGLGGSFSVDEVESLIAESLKKHSHMEKKIRG